MVTAAFDATASRSGDHVAKREVDEDEVPALVVKTERALGGDAGLLGLDRKSNMEAGRVASSENEAPLSKSKKKGCGKGKS